MNPNYNKYKKYKFKYKKLIEPFKDIIDKIDISDELLNETYLKNKDYFDNLINIKNEGNVYKYKYQKYKTRYLFMNKKLNGGAAFTGNTQDSSEEEVCKLSTKESEDRRKKLKKSEKNLYYASKGFKIGASTFLKIMAVVGAALPGGMFISAGVAILSTGKDVYDYTKMKKYEFYIIYSIFIFLTFSENSNYFIGKDKHSLTQMLENYQTYLKENNDIKEYKFVTKKEDIDLIYFKLNLLNDGITTISYYNYYIDYIHKWIVDVEKIKNSTDQIVTKETKFAINSMNEKKNKKLEDENFIINYIAKEKKLFKTSKEGMDKEKDLCRVSKILEIIYKFKNVIEGEKKKILEKYKHIKCIDHLDDESKLKLIFLLESSYVYAFTNKNANAILFNGIYNVILKNNIKKNKLGKNDSLQIENMFLILAIKLRKDPIVTKLYAGNDFLARKLKKMGSVFGHKDGIKDLIYEKKYTKKVLGKLKSVECIKSKSKKK
jgi:hypothetical protein